MMTINDEIRDILRDYVAGCISEEDKQKLDEWFEANGASEELRDSIISQIQLRNAFLWDKIDDKAALAKINVSLKRKNSRKKVLRYGAAASVALLCAISGWFFLPRDKGSEAVRPDWLPDEVTLLTTSGAVTLSGGQALEIEDGGTKINADSNIIRYGEEDAAKEDVPVVYNTLLIPRKGEHTLSLSDGSTIMLNSETRIRFPVLFSGDVREVFLEGEAYFDIKKNPDKPFIVHTNNTSIEVLGTTFNVSAYGNEANTFITLVEGSVRVASADTAEELVPGNQYRLDNHSMEHTVENVDTYIYTSWTEGVQRYESMPLETLMSKLNKWYDIDYEFRNEDLKRVRFTGGFKKGDDIKHILRVLEDSYKITFEERNGKIVIRKNIAVPLKSQKVL